jgi:uncharacterized phage protein (TIGR01671 family)
MSKDRFKFRAWNTKDKKFWGDFYLKSNGDMGKDSESDNIHYLEDVKDNNNILMQCTGLKDKNGKLIFEGDIIKGYPSDLIKRVVKWQTDVAGFDVIESVHMSHVASMSEIIGNIYENPDLVKE